METLKPCSEYDSENNRCKSGHVQVMPLCRGVAERGCANCGHSALIPQCLKEDPPEHLIRDDGMPLGWPTKEINHD